MRRLVLALAGLVLVFFLLSANERYRVKVLYIDGFYYELSTLNYPEGYLPPENPAIYAVLTNGDDQDGFRYFDTIPDKATKERLGHNFMEDGYYSGDIEIPEAVNYHDTVFPISIIGEYTFYNCKDLTSVRIPPRVNRICSFAFANCENLKHLGLPPSLKTLYEGFVLGTGIEEITLPDSIYELQPRFARGLRVHFSENQISQPSGPGPVIFDDADYEAKSNAGDSAFLLPKAHFWLWARSFCNGTFNTIIVPETDMFYCAPFAIYPLFPKQIVSMGVTPPKIIIKHFWNSPEYSKPSDGFTMPPYYEKDGDPMDLFRHTTLIVPKGSEEAYREAYVWRNFETIVGVESFDEYLGKDQAAVGLPSAEAEATIAFTRTGIEVTAPAPTTVEVTTLTGIAVARHTATAGSPLAIDLAPGLYIVKAGATVKKIKI